MFQFISRYFSNDIAIDLGTANTLIYLRDKGIVLDEPSVVAIQNTSGGRDAIVAVGTEAKKMQGRAPRNIHIVRPMKDGVIADFDITERMLGLLIKKAVGGRMVVPPRVVICVPGGSTQVERKAIRDSAFAAGAASVYLIEEPMAAALGAGLPIEDAAGSMVVDIGGGTTEIGILSLNGLAYSDSVRVGGDTFDEAIVHHLRRNRGVIIGETTAEEVKKKIGTVFGNDKTTAITVKGRSLAEGTPKSMAVTSDEVREALSEPLNQIVRSVRLALELAPPELAGDIADRGLVLTGGGALLKGMDLLLADATGLPVGIAGEPLNCVAYGAGKALDYIGTLNAVFVENM
ncbi:rod shape-determining protein MreB [Neisseria sp. oral taxon 014 str. F0314]|jgi:cell division protein ftsA|uniref:Cell shape-determining protein MreB n=1 Tax=Neisseria oralis TaxID=1107316 RepID=A0ABW8Q3K8_9NEIS|nr:MULTISPECIES: rod shape-determining protein [Neisseria]EFI24263.1 rod shape-determining protein MreB [Neisseria sp. oral taxon 014 str. F0314]RKV82040.1 MAG: rod shape-determining protein [Neisseria sp.]